MKSIFSTLLVISMVIIPGYRPAIAQHPSVKIVQDEEDSLVWRVAENFTTLFNKRDTASMNLFLPEDFMLQWVHENFLRKKGLLNAMRDTAVHTTLKHLLERNANEIIRYSDDRNAACLKTNFVFLDPALAESIKKKHGFGLCIMYFQKINNGWSLKTVHLDLHCSLCDL
jgi:hypothetical protein